MGSPLDPLDSLLEIMARLRDPERGCPWDRAQTFATIAPYTLEEAYELADAIGKGDSARLKDELGDLLFQVVFHARMAQERGWFDFSDVAGAICEKLVRRHPHVFADPPGPADPTALSRQWETHKAHERAAAALKGGESPPAVLADVPLALPALVRAGKLGKRAAGVGFDWASASEVREKVLEEARELDAAANEEARAPERSSGASEAVFEELGDLLFAVVNWSRHLNIEPESALRAANSKFERRFACMEQKARERGLVLSALSAAQWDRLWRECKRE
jgi:nucleoside triphosphate diphosphatase